MKMQLKVLLTTPYIDKIVEPLYDRPRFVRTSIASLAGFIREKNDAIIKCIDAKFDQLNLDNLIIKIIEFEPEIIGISSFTYEMEEAGILAENIKQKYNKECLIIIGGPHVSAIPIETLQRYQYFDICSIGESEETLSEIIKLSKRTKKWSEINGIVFKTTDGKFIKTPSRNKIKNLEVIPMPAWDLLPNASEYFIQMSRGCPFNCCFCFNPNGNIVRTRSAESVLTEINWLIKNKKPKRISFGDEAFGKSKREAFYLLDLMIEHKISHKISWDIQTHVTFIDEPFIQKLKQAGVSKIELGVETGNEEIMKSIGKGITKEKVLNAFKLCKKYHIKTGAFFILGHPDDNNKTIWETIKFAAEINPTEPIFGILVPFPGTRIALNQTEINFKIENWSNYRKQINGTKPSSSLSKIMLKKYFIIAIPVVFLKNFRLFGLAKFFFTNSNSFFKFVKHIFT